MSVCHYLHSWFGIKITHIFSFILPSTMSAACRSLKRRRASRSGKTLSGVLDSWTLESAANCSARFPRDTISGAQSAKAAFHTFLLFSKFWKFFLSSWWRGIIPVLDIIRAVSDNKLTINYISRVDVPVIGSWETWLSVFVVLYVAVTTAESHCSHVVIATSGFLRSSPTSGTTIGRQRFSWRNAELAF